MLVGRVESSQGRAQRVHQAEGGISRECLGRKADWPGWKGGFTQGQLVRTPLSPRDSWLELPCNPL